ncbi:MAG: UDP-glucose 4-epimerase GalE [SAR202 cluster bacterium]|nr:UDP-glucose 4-epimerase GalE [SAR202 cluster bacterium]
MKVLVTGGAGYIGSTICSALEDNKHIPVIIDSLVTGNKTFTERRIFYKADISDSKALKKIFSDHKDIEAIIHCAALVTVPESVKKPYLYYHENVSKSLELFKFASDSKIRIIFSSTAAVYKSSKDQMVTEDSPLGPDSPYARTKIAIEMALQDFCNAYGTKAISLRYFNPIGADPKMRSGPSADAPTHILGKLLSIFDGKESAFRIAGIDWPTRDGTAIRDYIHVWDLAEAHIKALESFDHLVTDGNPYSVINLGSGQGTTVLEFLEAFEEVSGAEITRNDSSPRPGDTAGAYANGDKAWDNLGWKPRMSIEQGIADAIKWNRKVS